MERQLIICGDIHGELRELVWKLTSQKSVDRADIVVAGDFGAGFGDLEAIYQRVKDKLDTFDIRIYAVRGNHDNPELFTGSEIYPRLTLLKDYEEVVLGNGKRILPVGGATSLDKEWRVEYEQKKKKKIWWENEGIVKLEGLENLVPKKVDIIISHEAPLTFEPVLFRSEGMSLDTYKKVKEDREYLDRILELVKCDRWFYGHYHQSMSGSYGSLLWRGLNILELYQVL